MSNGTFTSLEIFGVMIPNSPVAHAAQWIYVSLALERDILSALRWISWTSRAHA